MLYFAFGSNLDEAAMRRRCPAAKKIGPFYLPQAKLVFRGVADIEHCYRSTCPGGIWEITKDCERSLDVYEGVAGGLYRKTYLKVYHRTRRRHERMLTYQMNRGGVMPPGEHYFDVIARGYEDFGLDPEYLHAALAQSWDDKKPTKFLRRRRATRNDGDLATTLRVAW